MLKKCKKRVWTAPAVKGLRIVLENKASELTRYFATFSASKKKMIVSYDKQYAAYNYNHQ